MVKKTVDDAARELLLATESEREAHAIAVQALLARNASLRTNDELVDDELRADRTSGLSGSAPRSDAPRLEQSSATAPSTTSRSTNWRAYSGVQSR